MVEAGKRAVGRSLLGGLLGLLAVSAMATMPAYSQEAETTLEEGTALDEGGLELFEAYLDGVMAAQFRDYDLAGMTFALVRDGALVFSKGYGVSSLETGEPVDPSRTLFRPGSVSKLFTWTALMQLVEQGLVDLDAPVSGYIHQFELPNEFDQPLTLKHILTHAPGLEDGAAGYLFADSADDLVPLAESLAAHIPNQIWAPGTYSAYSNWATAVAGLVVANVSGLSFEDYVREHIFRPLGMTQATFDEPLPEVLAADMAQGYIGGPGGIDPMGFEFIKNFGPAGALSASAEAMASFIIAHVQDGAYGDSRILEAATAQQMHSRLFAHDSRVAGMAHGFYEIRRNGKRFVGHAGDTIAFHSGLVIQPDMDFGFFLSFNTPDGGQARTAVVDAVIDYFYPASKPEALFKPESLEGSEERIAKIAGAYRLNRRSYTKLEGVTGLAGDLQIAPGAPGEIIVPAPGIGGRFVEVEPYVFSKKGRQEMLVFQTTGEGAVSRVFIGSLPIMVGDRLSAWEAASNHQLVIVLALLAAFFVLLNWIRAGRSAVHGAARLARTSLNLASLSYLIFALGMGLVFAGADMDEMIFDFPPAGTGLVLVFPLLGVLFTVVSAAMLAGVWRSGDCNVWQRIRYSYVVVVYSLLAGVFWYWNLLGWHY